MGKAVLAVLVRGSIVIPKVTYHRFGVDITALVVFTGDKHQKKRGSFDREFAGTKVHFSFNTFHILDYSERELLSRDNPFALIVLAAQKALLRGKVPEEELANSRLTVARALIQSGKYDHDKLLRFLHFLKTFLFIENPEINRNFDREIEVLTRKENAMGIIETLTMIAREEGTQKGIERGKKENMISTAEILLKRGMSVQEVSEITTLTIKEVTEIREKIQP